MYFDLLKAWMKMGSGMRFRSMMMGETLGRSGQSKLKAPSGRICCRFRSQRSAVFHMDRHTSSEVTYNRLNTPNRTPETSWEDTWIQKKDVVFGCFLPAQCLPRNPLPVVAAFIRVFQQRCFAATEDNLFGPWQTEEQFEVGFHGVPSVASGDAPWCGKEYWRIPSGNLT